MSSPVPPSNLSIIDKSIISTPSHLLPFPSLQSFPLPPSPPLLPLSPFLADVMSNQGAQTILSVDVGAEDNNDLTNYGDYLSGWWLLWNSLNPFAKKVRVSQAACGSSHMRTHTYAHFVCLKKQLTANLRLHVLQVCLPGAVCVSVGA